MADFFSRIFAIPSDDEESTSADETYSRTSSIQRSPRKNLKQSKSKPTSKQITRHSSFTPADEDTNVDESSSTGDDDRLHSKPSNGSHRGRQRRNDSPSLHRSESEPRRQVLKKKRSSSERPTINPNAPPVPHPQSRSRKQPTISPTSDSSLSETKQKMKSWRSKFSAGMKKHLSPNALSPTSASTPFSAAPTPICSNARRPHDSNVGSRPQPINVGDYITISQQYLEDAAEVSVLTMPKELTKEVDEANLMQIIGQRGVLGNNAVQAFLDRRTTAAKHELNKSVKNPVEEEESVDTKMYERVSSYANRLLDISYSQSVETSVNNQSVGEEGVEVEVNSKGLDVSSPNNRELVETHVWPAEGEVYSPPGTGGSTVGTEREIGSIGGDAPLSPSTVSSGNERRMRITMPATDDKSGVSQSSQSVVQDRRLQLQPLSDDKSGPSVSSPVSEKSEKSSHMRRPFDEPSMGPGASAGPASIGPEEENVDPRNKSVKFSLPPPSSHPPAPPFLGPTLDYYYSMEREDQAPIWSNPTLLPPIIELWSPVEGGNGVGGSAWNVAKEEELCGDDASLNDLLDGTKDSEQPLVEPVSDPVSPRMKENLSVNVKEGMHDDPCVSSPRSPKEKEHVRSSSGVVNSPKSPSERSVHASSPASLSERVKLATSPSERGKSVTSPSNQSGVVNSPTSSSERLIHTSSPASLSERVKLAASPTSPSERVKPVTSPTSQRERIKLTMSERGSSLSERGRSVASPTSPRGRSVASPSPTERGTHVTSPSSPREKTLAFFHDVLDCNDEAPMDESANPTSPTARGRSAASPVSTTERGTHITSPSSPKEKTLAFFHDVLDCNDEAPMDETSSTHSSIFSKTDQARKNSTEPTGPDSFLRHRSQWRSSQNVTYKPPMFNSTGNSAPKEDPSLQLGKSESSEDPVLQLRRFHGDDVSSPKNQQPQDLGRPIILHGRVVRPTSVPSNTSNLSKTYSVTRSPSNSSYGSVTSYHVMKGAAIAVQASFRSMRERQRLFDMINSIMVIQCLARRYICRQRYLLQLKLKRTYYRCNWKKKVLS